MQALNPSAIDRSKKLWSCCRRNQGDSCDAIVDDVDQIVLRGGKDLPKSEVGGCNDKQEVSPELKQGPRVARALPQHPSQADARITGVSSTGGASKQRSLQTSLCTSRMSVSIPSSLLQDQPSTTSLDQPCLSYAAQMVACISAIVAITQFTFPHVHIGLVCNINWGEGRKEMKWKLGANFFWNDYTAQGARKVSSQTVLLCNLCEMVSWVMGRCSPWQRKLTLALVCEKVTSLYFHVNMSIFQCGFKKQTNIIPSIFYICLICNFPKCLWNKNVSMVKAINEAVSFW